MKRRPPLAPRVLAQYAIPMPGQRLPGRESRYVYRAITDLRLRGFSVWRVGRDHLVGQSLISTQELFKVARTVRRQVPLHG
jgi:hypothetical protein